MVTTERHIREKIPYTASETARFVIAEDPFSQARFSALISLQADLQEGFQVNTALSVCGSLTKGAMITPDTANRRDIDFYVLLNERDMRRRLSSPLLPGEEHPDLPRIEEFITTYMREQAQAMGFSGEPHFHKVVRQIDFHGKSSIRAAVNALLLNPTSKHLQERVASYFHLAIGGLKVYQQAFLNEYMLANRQQHGEYEWAHVAQAIANTERNGVIPQSLREQYPENFQEALRYYGVAIAKSR